MQLPVLMFILAPGRPDELVKKIAQNVAQRISCQKFCITFVVEKSSPNLWDISEIIISLTYVCKENNDPIGDNFANLVALPCSPSTRLRFLRR
jgi:hypothetical protein